MNIIHQLDRIDIYGTSIPNTNRTHLWSSCGTFTKTEHIMSLKISLNKFKRIGIT